MRQGAQGWCTGMEREVGGGFRMGNTCTPMTDSCQCMAKPIQYCKVISLPKNKEKKEKKNKKKIKSRDVTLSTKFHLVKAVIFQ